MTTSSLSFGPLIGNYIIREVNASLIFYCHKYEESWKEFLIHAQSPDATAVLEIEKWNNSFHSWVNKEVKGIAVFNEQYAGRQHSVRMIIMNFPHVLEICMTIKSNISLIL